MDLGIKGRTALVTASSRGLGWAAACRLSQEGVRVALCGRDRGRIDAARQRLVDVTGGEALAFAVDVTDNDAVSGMVRSLEETWGSVDILVCNAGGPPAGSYEDFGLDDYRRATELNLMSTIRLCYQVLPRMKAKGWGRIITITSVAAKQPLENLILSNTARAGVLGFGKTLAGQVAAAGITVNSLLPGYTRTERIEELAVRFVKDGQGSEEDFYDKVTASIPARRMGRPEEFAQAVAFLASEGAAYITGVALQVDGGFCSGIL